MGDDAEWFDVNTEFGRPVRPPPRRLPTERPFWLTPRYPSTTPHTPHEAPEVLAPAGRGVGDHGETLAVTMGLLGGLMGVLLVLLLVYMFVLRRRLSRARSEKAKEDYSIRVTDVAHLSSTLDDSSQLYANTTDLHKLMSSVKANRKNPPPPLPPPNGKPRPPAPAPDATTVSFRKPKSRRESLVDAKEAVVTNVRRMSEKISNNIHIPNLLNQLNKMEEHQKSTETVISMPEVVEAGTPQSLDDDDIWSEDSFDSFDEDENSFPVRVASTRRSNRSVRRSRREVKRASPPIKPSVAPPAPPGAIYGNTSSPPPPSLKPVGVVRPAPPVPVTHTSSTASSVSSTNSHYDSVKPPVSTTPPSAPSKKPSKPPLPALPVLPKPHKSKDSSSPKPPPPVTPKPAAKPHLLPKLQMGLSVPSSRPERTPDTASTLLTSTPCLEEADRFTRGLTPPTRIADSADVDPATLSVSARKALLEGKNILGK